MNNSLNNMKFSSDSYKNKFMATDKQKDFIIDNIDYLEDEEASNIIKNINNLTKKEASEIIEELISIMEWCEDYDGYDDWFWK